MIRPLLEITTTQARYEYEISRAKLEVSQTQPKVQRTTRRATLNMRQEAGRFEMNTVRRRSDMGFKGVVEQAEHQADLGRKSSAEATVNYVVAGNQMGNIANGGNIPDALWSQSMQHSRGDLVLVPVSPVDIHYVPASIATDFQPGEMSVDWNVGRARLEFVPGTFAIKFTQYSSINIEYTGGPIYAPPSADPNFKGEA